MLDPLAAIALTGNILQFLDFGLKATSKAREIHRSVSGVLSENLEIEELTTHLTSVTSTLATSAGNPTGNTALDDIVKRCTAAGDELLVALRGLKFEGQKSRLKSLRKGLKAVWGRKRVEEMRGRLVGLRNEIQFYLLVDLKSNINVESVKRSERFDALDQSAKTVVESFSESQRSIRIECIKSDKTFQEMAVTIVAKQDAVQAEVKDAVSDHANVVLESVSETQKSVTHALSSLDKKSRMEHAATQRELEEIKQAMVQIRADLARRDEELKILLRELRQSHDNKERKRLQERSNAVTVALYALVTIHESLQKIRLGLQSYAMKILANTNFGQLWDISSPSIVKPHVHRRLLEGVINKTQFISEVSTTTMKMKYLKRIDRQYGWLSDNLRRTCATEFHALEVIDYRKIGLKSGLNSRLLGLVRQETCTLLEILDPSPTTSDECSDRLGTPSVVVFDRVPKIIETLRSLTIISTLLVNCLNFPDAKIMISGILQLPEYLGPQNVDNHDFILIPPDDYASLKSSIISWATISRIAGFQKNADTILKSRLEKWSIEGPVTMASCSGAVLEFFEWFIQKPNESVFYVDIGNEEKRRCGAVLFAVAEFLSEHGFSLAPPVIQQIGGDSIWALVKRCRPTDDNINDEEVWPDWDLAIDCIFKPTNAPPLPQIKPGENALRIPKSRIVTAPEQDKLDLDEELKTLDVSKALEILKAVTLPRDERLEMLMAAALSGDERIDLVHSLN